MKRIFILLVIVLFGHAFTDRGKHLPAPTVEDLQDTKTETALVIGHTSYKIAAPVKYDCDSLQKKYDSLLWVVKEKNFRLRRIQFYYKIVQRKPSQKKFLDSWVSRAVN